VQRDGRDLLAYFIKNMLVGHRDLPVLVIIGDNTSLLICAFRRASRRVYRLGAPDSSLFPDAP
jgi:hypothetical protein